MCGAFRSESRFLRKPIIEAQVEDINGEQLLELNKAVYSNCISECYMTLLYSCALDINDASSNNICTCDLVARYISFE